MKKASLFVLSYLVASAALASPADIEEGYRYQIAQKNKQLELHAKELDALYDFKRFAKDGMLPPAIRCSVSGKGSLDNPLYHTRCQAFSEARNLYQDGHAMSWRDFLVVPSEYSGPAKDNDDFREGMYQANSLAIDNWERMTNHYKGMVLYQIVRYSRHATEIVEITY